MGGAERSVCVPVDDQITYVVVVKPWAITPPPHVYAPTEQRRAENAFECSPATDSVAGGELCRVVVGARGGQGFHLLKVQEAASRCLLEATHAISSQSLPSQQPRGGSVRVSEASPTVTVSVHCASLSLSLPVSLFCLRSSG